MRGDASCAVEVDGTLTGGLSFFVEPAREHEIAAGFEHRPLNESRQDNLSLFVKR